MAMFFPQAAHAIFAYADNIRATLTASTIHEPSRFRLNALLWNNPLMRVHIKDEREIATPSGIKKQIIIRYNYLILVIIRRRAKNKSKQMIWTKKYKMKFWLRVILGNHPKYSYYIGFVYVKQGYMFSRQTKNKQTTSYHDTRHHQKNKHTSN